MLWGMRAHLVRAIRQGAIPAKSLASWMTAHTHGARCARPSTCPPAALLPQCCAPPRVCLLAAQSPQCACPSSVPIEKREQPASNNPRGRSAPRTCCSLPLSPPPLLSLHTHARLQHVAPRPLPAAATAPARACVLAGCGAVACPACTSPAEACCLAPGASGAYAAEAHRTHLGPRSP